MAVRAGDLDQRRIQLEAAPAEDHLVARRGGDLNELLAQADRTAADGDVLGGEARAQTASASAALSCTQPLSG